LIASYEDRISDTKDWLEKAQNSEDIYIKTSSAEIVTALDEFGEYRDGKRDFLATLLGKAYLNIGQVTLSIYKLSAATEMTPEYESAWKLLGVALIAAKQYPEAKEALSKVKANNDPEILYFEGIASFNANDFANSIRAFKQAQKAGYNDDEKINRYLADSYLAEEEYENAQKLYIKLIQSSPEDISMYEKAIFISLSVLNDTKTAFTIAKKAIAHNSQSHLSHYYIALVAFKKNDFKTARTYITSSFKLNDEYSPAYFLSGELYEITEDNKAANTEYKKIIKLNNDEEYVAKAKRNITALEENEEQEEEQ
jgi:tetratricopeptide (TPR) repeat protein